MIEDKREGVVGASGFQPLTSWIPTRRSQGLRTVNRATTVFETVARRFQSATLIGSDLKF